MIDSLRFFGVLVLAGAAAVCPADAAQPVRTRSLTYDAEHKTWVELPPPPPGTPEGDLYRIQMQIKEGHHKKALAAIKRIIKTSGKKHARYPELLTAKAQALIGVHKYYKAHLVLQEFLNQFGGMTLTSEALRLEFVIAETFLRGVKRKFLGLRFLSGTDIAYSILDDISANFPETEMGELAIKTKADHLFRTGEHALAESQYARLLKEYPQSRYHRYALKKAADAALASFRGIEFDGAALIEAQERYEEYRHLYTVWADQEGVGLILADMKQKRAQKDLSVGAYYERTGHLASAIFYFRSVIENWPKSVAAGLARSRLGLLEAS